MTKVVQLTAAYPWTNNISIRESHLVLANLISHQILYIYIGGLFTKVDTSTGVKEKKFIELSKTDKYIRCSEVGVFYLTLEEVKTCEFNVKRRIKHHLYPTKQTAYFFGLEPWKIND